MSCKAGDGCSTIASGFDLCDTESLHHGGALQTFLFACRHCRRANRHVSHASGRATSICRSKKSRPVHIEHTTSALPPKRKSEAPCVTSEKCQQRSLPPFAER